MKKGETTKLTQHVLNIFLSLMRLVILVVLDLTLANIVTEASPISDIKHETSPGKEIRNIIKTDIKEHAHSSLIHVTKLPTLDDRLNKFHENKDSLMRSTDFKSYWNFASTTSRVSSTTNGKESSDISPFVIVAIVLSGIVGLYVVYLLLLLSVVSWTYLFQRFNMYKYVEVVE